MMKLKVVLALAVVTLLGCACGARAQEKANSAAPALDPPAASAGNFDAVQDEVKALRQEVSQLKSELDSMRGQKVAASSSGSAAAARADTDKISALQSDLGKLKKDISENLGVHFHGLTDATYEFNFNRPDTTGFTKGGSNAVSTGGATNQLRVFDIDANGFSLQQFNLHIDRVSDGGVGFVTDLNFGQVANVLRASTRYSNLNPGSVSNGIIDPTQLYLTYTIPVGTGINLSIGKFVTLLGEEVIPVYNNFDYNESKSFIFGFGIPFTHTGIRAQYTFNDKVGLTLGVNNGWDDVADNNYGQTVEGQLALTPTGALTIDINGIYGPEQVNHGNSKRGAVDSVATWKTPFPGLQLIGEYLYAHETGPVSATPATTSNGNSLLNYPSGPDGTVTIGHGVSWQGAAGYIVYDLNDNVELATRGEWFRDSDGARTGLRQTLGEITETLNYKVPAVSGLLARLEYRHDMSSAKPFFSGDGFNLQTSLPFHTYSGQDTIEAAAIYSF
jgi:Putative beta-barrel porin-2, OmpL-like. bbp2